MYVCARGSDIGFLLSVGRGHKKHRGGPPKEPTSVGSKPDALRKLPNRLGPHGLRGVVLARRAAKVDVLLGRVGRLVPLLVKNVTTIAVLLWRGIHSIAVAVDVNIVIIRNGTATVV